MELFEGDYFDDTDHYNDLWVPHNEHQNRRYNRKPHFITILEKIKEEEKKVLSPEDEERLFDKVSLYLKKPFCILGIYTLQKLAFIPSTVSADRLKGIATIICKNVFNPLLGTDRHITEYVDFCKGFAYLEARTNEGVILTFEQILISTFLDELPKKFNFRGRLTNLLKNRNLPQEKKQKWLEKHIEEQEQAFKIETQRSINFLDKLFQLYPEIVYRVIEFLLQCEEEDEFHYLCELLGKVVYPNDIQQFAVTNVYEMKSEFWRKHEFNMRELGPLLPLPSKNLTPLFERITTLSNHNIRILHGRGQSRNSWQDLQRILQHPLKENYPQDFVKYCIKDLLSGRSLEDDFKIDDEDKFDCSTYSLRSRNFSERFSLFIWKGLQVKFLVKRSEKPKVRLQRRQ